MVSFFFSLFRTAEKKDEDERRERVRLCRRHGSFDHRFPVEVRGPVDQVEGTEEDGEDYPRHLVDLADAVVGLLGVGRRLALGALHLHRGAVGDGGDGRVFGDVGREVHAGGARVVGFLGERQRVFLLQEKKSTSLHPSATFTFNIYSSPI